MNSKCDKYSNKWSFFFLSLLCSVPHEPIVRSKWIEQISRHQQFDERPRTYPVCCLHFNEDEITKSGKRSVLKKGAVPTSFPE